MPFGNNNNNQNNNQTDSDKQATAESGNPWEFTAEQLANPWESKDPAAAMRRQHELICGKGQEKVLQDDLKKQGYVYAPDGRFIRRFGEAGAIYVYSELLKATQLPISATTFFRFCAMVYAESSGVKEESFAIANTTSNYSTATGKPLIDILSKKGYSSAIGGALFTNYITKEFYTKQSADRFACAAVINALGGGQDYSNGAIGWDGVDLKTNYIHHPRITSGYHIANPSHNVLNINENILPVQSNYVYKNTDPKFKELRFWTYQHETTAGYGKTMFYKLSNEWRAAHIKSDGTEKWWN
jgi:hypothetical protein